MNDIEYKEFISKYNPKVNKLKTDLIVFISGGIMGVLAESLLELYVNLFSVSRKDASVLVTLSFILISSILTSLGIFDVLVKIFKCALIIPITGFAHSITSCAIEYRNEGLVLGVGANIFKLAGSVILFGIVSVYIFGILRLIW